MTTTLPYEAGPSPATVRCNNVSLRAVMPSDYDAIRLAELEGPNAITYRNRGRVVSPEQFAADLWAGVVAQFVIVDDNRGRALGTVTAYNGNFRSGWCYMAALVFPGRDGRKSFMEGVALFLDYLFEAFPFRKLYAEALDESFRNFSSVLSRGWTEVACFPEHEATGSGFSDLHVLQLTRTAWVQDDANTRTRSHLAEQLRQELGMPGSAS